MPRTSLLLHFLRIPPMQLLGPTDQRLVECAERSRPAACRLSCVCCNAGFGGMFCEQLLYTFALSPLHELHRLHALLQVSVCSLDELH